MDPVQQISIIPSGNALGYTLNPPKDDKFSVYKEELKQKITMLLGGRAAEEIIFGDISGGASNDIQRATEIAKKMVTQLGMSELLGPRAFGSGQGEVFLGRDFSHSQDYSDSVAAQIDSEIHAIISEAYNRAKEILTENIDKLHFISEFLLKNEIMDGEQFTAAMEGSPTFEELEEMTEAKRRKSREENDERRRQLERERIEKERAEAETAANAGEPPVADLKVEEAPIDDIPDLPTDEEAPEEIPSDTEAPADDSDSTSDDENKTEE
jgi:cell division protease FtsH